MYGGEYHRNTPPPPAQVGALAVLAARRAARLEELVRWLALPYGDNTPIFNEDSDAMDSLGELYCAVVWNGTPKLPPMPGVWVKCPTCACIHVRSVDDLDGVEWDEPFFDHRTRVRV